MSYYRAPDHQNIVNLFIKYANTKKTSVISKPGFYGYLALKIAYPGWFIKEIKRQIRKDANLSEFIESAIEGILVDGMNAGVYKADGVKFTLKNHYGYSDNPDHKERTETSTTKTIVYRLATEQDVKK